MMPLGLHHLSRYYADRTDIVARNLAQDRAVICVIRWVAGTAHAVVLSGVGLLSTVEVFQVRDPVGRIRVVPCDEFRKNYDKRGGTWIETHYGA